MNRQAEENSIQTRFAALEQENATFKNQLSLQGKNILFLNTSKMAISSAFFITSVVLLTTAPASDCSQERMNECINTMARNGAFMGIATISGAFFLLEIMAFILAYNAHVF